MPNPFKCIANDTARYFTHQGISCMTQLGPFTINGYVELPEHHPWLDFPDTLEMHPDIEVHGGITYHTGRVIGFDTNHLGDGHHPDAEHACLTGEYLDILGGIPHVWTWEEVETETRRLAEQEKDTHTMTNPTRQEIIDAHEALLELSGLAEELAVTEVEARQAWKYHAYILAALPPKPQPTMADVEWDDDKHFLAGATTPIGPEAVMLWHDDEESGNIITTTGEWRRDQLTPTGKRYTLTEVQDD